MKSADDGGGLIKVVVGGGVTFGFVNKGKVEELPVAMEKSVSG